MATHGFAEEAARRMDEHQSRRPLYKELTANLVANARMVPAGIVAVNRAQERGYTLVTT